MAELPTCLAWATVGLVLTDDGWRDAKEVDAEAKAKKDEKKVALEAELAKLTEQVLTAEITWNQLGDQFTDLRAKLSAVEAKYKIAEQAYVDTCAKRAQVLNELKKLTE